MASELFAIQPDDMYDDQAQQNENVKKHLTFFSEGLQYAIDASYVNDIITNYSITMLPMVPHFIKGVMNLRGQITPVVDIRLLMNRPGCEDVEKACIIVLEVNEVSLGILVDGVSRVVDLDQDVISTAPHSVDQEIVYGIANIDGHVNLLVDCERLISSQ